MHLKIIVVSESRQTKFLEKADKFVRGGEGRRNLSGYACDLAVIVSQAYRYIQICQIAQFKYVHLIVC